MRLVWPAILAAASLPAAAATAELPDLGALRQCAREAWAADVKSWSSYSFDRHVVLRDMDKNGEVKSERVRHFRLTPIEGGFDELLITENGRPATNREIAKARDKAIVSGNYKNADTLELSNPLGEDLVLLPVLGAQNYELFGEDEVDGIPCYRAEFEAGPEPRRGSTEEQLTQGVRGSACVSIDGCHLVQLQLETVRPIKQGLTRIDGLSLKLGIGPAGDGGWVIKEVEAEFDFVVVGKHLRRSSSYSYSNFLRH